MVGNGGDEGEEVAAAEELGEEQGGVALGFGGVDPPQAGPQYARFAATFPKHSTAVAAHDYDFFFSLSFYDDRD